MRRHHTLELLVAFLIGLAVAHFYHNGLPGKGKQ